MKTVSIFLLMLLLLPLVSSFLSAYLPSTIGRTFNHKLPINHQHLKKGSRIPLWSTANNEEEPFWDPKLHPKLDPLEDYYNVLEVEPTVTEEKLKKAYYKLVIKYHPDNKSSKHDKDLANRQMMVINSAYRVLKDPLLRTKYNQIRQNKKAANADVAFSQQRYDRSSTRTAGPTVGQSSYMSVDASQEATDTTISFQDFKLFLEDIYERSFPNDSPFVQDLYCRLQSDPEFRANIIRNGDFRRSRITASSTGTATSSSVSQPNDDDMVYSRGDGSLLSLKKYLVSLKHRKSKKEELLRADKRDWGDIKDLELIRARLKAIDELRDLGQEIEHLEDEIHFMEYRMQDRRQSYSDELNYWQHKQEVDDDRYEHYRESHNPWRENKEDYSEPRSQPQPQRTSDNQKKVSFWGDESDYGPRWRDDQLRRRRGE